MVGFCECDPYCKTMGMMLVRVFLRSNLSLTVCFLFKQDRCLIGRSQGWTQGPGPAVCSNIYIYIIVIICLIFIVRPLSKPQILLLLNKPSQPHLDSNYPTKKLNKNNKNIHNGDCILAKKNYFTTKEPKKHALSEKLKLNFLQLQ